jgi:hypothetical protein
MDEVKAMTHTGETVGRAVGTGLRSLRRGAVQAGQASAGAVRDAVADTQDEVVRTTRKARRQLAKQADATAKQMSKNAKKARKSTAKNLDKATKKARRRAAGSAGDLAAALQPAKQRRRRWPWLLGAALVVAGAGAAYSMKGKQATTMPADDLPERDLSATNGSTPYPRPSQPTDNPVNHTN